MNVGTVRPWSLAAPPLYELDQCAGAARLGRVDIPITLDDSNGLDLSPGDMVVDAGGAQCAPVPYSEPRSTHPKVLTYSCTNLTAGSYAVNFVVSKYREPPGVMKAL